MNNETALFETSQRAHIGLAVRDVERAAAFYETLLGVAPSKVRPGYAKFEPKDPSLNLSLNEVAGATGPTYAEAHFGIQVQTADAVKEAIERLHRAGLETRVEESTTCCYAVQDKVWVSDPDGHSWEVFVVLDPDADERGGAVRSECCPAEAAGCCDEPAGCCG